jgi:hypothetical protein
MIILSLSYLPAKLTAIEALASIVGIQSFSHFLEKLRLEEVEGVGAVVG